MTRILDIRFEHQLSPAIGIGEDSPRLSWRFEGDEPNWVQTVYHLEISRKGGSPEIFEVRSPQSVLVPWPTERLNSREQCRVRVRAICEHLNSSTPWSDTATVEAGLLQAEDWKASLIQPEISDADEPHRPIIFRDLVKVQSPVRSGRLYISAQGVYEARINGQQVGDDVLAPGWTSYSHRLIYQTYDVTELFNADAPNDVTIHVGPGWFCGRLGFHGGRSGIYGERVGTIAQLVLELENGDVLTTGTGEHWKCAFGAYLSAELYDGVVYDANKELSAKSTWESVRVRPAPKNLFSPSGPPIRRTQILAPISIFKSPSGKTVVDFGQNFVGWVHLKVEGPPGTTIQLQHTEVLEDGEIATRPLRDVKARDTLTLSGNSITWEPKFTFHGFRYVQVDGYPGELSSDAIAGVVVNTDMQRIGHFSSSNKMLNKLHENVVWSMRGNFLSIPTDCPQRDERLGWTGDINIFAETANFLYDTTGFLNSWLEDLKCEQNNGIVPLVVPNIIDGFEKEPHAVWGDVAVMLPWALFNATGDKSILSRQFHSMESWLQSIPRKSDQLWDYGAAWKLGDWLDPAAPPDDPGNATTDPDLVSDAFLVHITTLMATISAELGKRESLEKYKEASRNLRSAFSHKYITRAGRLASDSQTAFTLAINFGLFENTAQEEAARDRLELLIRSVSRFKIATGFAGTPYVGHALTKVGLSNIFYRMLLHRKNPSWLFPVSIGATTIWERWDSMLPNGKINPGEMTSFNHYALGSVASWMHRNIIGLRPLEDGWRVFAIEPIPGGGLTSAEGSFLSPYGDCKVRWAIAEGKEPGIRLFSLFVVVPPNSKAEVKLPGTDGVVKVGSGKYDWTVSFVPEEWPPRAIYPPTMEADDDLEEDTGL
ncbi:hypothetical protein V496_06781 [Pseudogymnoascus sp. VKM F-4515 (FW-2607)]|nr:hypothetical protein V496_06781 [Pseudogymnoascus sp. VKM F-4515 (FW-2607)]KFY97523.1 hypothetical protein V498_02015 [Pseudogymnoascus sp. VKM F-4517 (FW-2822)]